MNYDDSRDFEYQGEKIGNVKHYITLKRLIEGVFNNIRTDKLFEILEDILTHPVLITDMGFHVVGQSPSVTENPQYSGLCTDEFLLDDSCSQMIRSHYFTTISKRHFLSEMLFHEKWGNIIVTSIKISDVDVMIMLIFLGEEGTNGLDLLLLKKIAQVMAIEFQKENGRNRDRFLLPNQTIKALLSGKKLSSEEIEQNLDSTRWTRAKGFYLLILTDTSGISLDKRALSLLGNLKVYIPINHCILHENNLICFLTRKLYLKLFHDEEEGFRAFLDLSSLRGTVSSYFTPLSECSKALDQAKKVAKTAEKFQIQLAKFEEMRFLIVADYLEEHFRLTDFCHPAVIKLVQYDREKNTTLLHTLRCYLEDRKDINTVLAKLYIHRSTLFYRLNKIKTLTGINLEDIPELTDIYYSLKMIDAYGTDIVNT